MGAETGKFGLSLKWNFSWTLAGNVVYAASQWVLLMLIAKTGSAETVGQFSYATAVTAPIITFSELGLRSIQATDARKEYYFGHYLGLRLLTTLLALLVIGIVIQLKSSNYYVKSIIFIVGLAKSFEAISDIIYGLLQYNELMNRIAYSLIIKGILSILFFGLIFATTHSLLLSVIGLAFSRLILLVFYDLYNVLFIAARIDKSIELHNYIIKIPAAYWDRTKLLRLAYLAFPLGLVKLVVSLQANIPRYFIEHYLGEAQLGIYAALGYIMVAGNLVNTALGQSASPRLAKYYVSNKIRNFCRLLLKLLFLGGMIGILGVVIAYYFGYKILSIMYSQEYAAYNHIFVLLMVGFLFHFLSGFVGYSLTAVRYLNVQVPTNLLNITLIAVVSYLLIPKHGLTGAAAGAIITNIVDLVVKSCILIHALSRTQKDFHGR